jgi:hypothetical protein
MRPTQLPLPCLLLASILTVIRVITASEPSPVLSLITIGIFNFTAIPLDTPFNSSTNATVPGQYIDTLEQIFSFHLSSRYYSHQTQPSQLFGTFVLFLSSLITIFPYQQVMDTAKEIVPRFWARTVRRTWSNWYQRATSLQKTVVILH